MAKTQEVVDDDTADRIQKKIDEAELPEASPLTLIKEALGGQAAVAELSGRSEFMERVAAPGTGWRLARRKRSAQLELQDFQAGKKRVAILTAAFGTGTSLHAEGRNARKRLQILFEVPYSSTTAVQMLGRTLRANQRVPPRFLVLASSHGPDRRFGATLASRLAPLGARQQAIAELPPPTRPSTPAGSAPTS